MHADEVSVFFFANGTQHNSCLSGQPLRTAHCKHHLLLQTTSRVCDFHIRGQSPGECGRELLTEKIGPSETGTLYGQLRVTGIF